MFNLVVLLLCVEHASASTKDPVVQAKVDALNQRLAMAYEQQDLPEALHVLAKAAKLDPSDARHFLNRGGILQMMGPQHAFEAHAAFQQAARAEPKSPIPFLHLAQITPPGMWML